MNLKNKVTPKNIIKAVFVFVLLIAFAYFAGFAIGEAIGYL